MNNQIENSLRLYNVKKLRRTRMHSYTKKNIDNAILSVLYNTPVIEICPLSNEDIVEYKKNFDEKKFEEYLCQTYNYQPCKKKIRLQDESEEKNPETLKLVLCREGETDKFTSQFKTVNNEKDNTSATSSCNTSSSSSSATEVSLENQPSKELPNKINVNSIIGSVRVKKDDFFFANEKDIEKFRIMFRDKNSKNVANQMKKIPNIIPFNSANIVFNTPVIKEKIPLREIERLYQKYFSKAVQDTIVIIANILNMISLSNKHHKFRMDESFKKKTEAEKLKERCDANRMHLRHKKVLEAKLKANFLDVINKFIECEFEPTFQMFFLSILTVLRVLEQPKFKKGSIFKNLVLLLWNSLKNCDFDNPKVFGLFRSKSFRPDCIDLISLIEDSRNCDPGITDRLALFFLSTVNSRESFQPVLNALTSDSNEDLGQLLDNAIRYCRLHSKFKDRVENSSLPTQESVIPTLAATSVQNNVPVEDNQQCLLANAPNGPNQQLLSGQPANEQKIQKTTYVISDPNKPRMFYENFSNSLNQTPLSESSTPKVIGPKVSVVTTTAVSSGSLGHPTLLIKQNFKPIPTSTIQRSEFNTIFVGNKQYQLIRGPTGQLKAVATSSLSTTTTSNVVTSNVVFRPAVPQKPMDVVVRCFAKNCKSPATIMCSTCKSVKYCSNTCQRQDWYESHIHNCQRLKSMKLNHC